MYKLQYLCIEPRINQLNLNDEREKKKKITDFSLRQSFSLKSESSKSSDKFIFQLYINKTENKILRLLEVSAPCFLRESVPYFTKS